MGWAVAIFGEAKWTAKARAAFEATPIDVEAVTWPEGFAGGAVEPGTGKELVARLVRELEGAPAELVHVDANTRRLKLRACVVAQSFEDLGRSFAAVFLAAGRAGARGELVFLGLGEGLCYRVEIGPGVAHVVDVDDVEAQAYDEEHPAYAELVGELARRRHAEEPLPGAAGNVEPGVLDALAAAPPDALVAAARAAGASAPSKEGWATAPLVDVFPDAPALVAALRAGSSSVGPWPRKARLGAALAVLSRLDPARADAAALAVAGELPDVAWPVLAASPRPEALVSLLDAIDAGDRVASQCLAARAIGDANAQVLARFDAHAAAQLAARSPERTRALWGYLHVIQAHRLAAAIPRVRALDAARSLDAPLGAMLVALGDAPSIEDLPAALRMADELTRDALVERVIALHPDRVYEALAAYVRPEVHPLALNHFFNLLVRALPRAAAAVADARWVEVVAPYVAFDDTTIQGNALGVLSLLPRAQAQEAAVARAAGMHLETLLAAATIFGLDAFGAVLEVERARRPARDRTWIDKTVKRLTAG